jgi:hypothetical protein
MVSMLMSHDTGIVLHYLRPNEEDILSEYQKAIPLLMINQEKNAFNLIFIKLAKIYTLMVISSGPC